MVQKQRKKIGVGILAVLIVCFLVGLYLAWRKNEIGVSALPDGYLLLTEAEEASEGKLKFIFSEREVFVRNEDEETLYETTLDNDEFIVKYNRAYYVRKLQCEKLLNQDDPHGIRAVLALPPGFEPMQEVLDLPGGAVDWDAFETQLVFIAYDRHGEPYCIYQTDLNNVSIILEYKGEYYLHREHYEEAVGIAP